MDSKTIIEDLLGLPNEIKYNEKNNFDLKQKMNELQGKKNNVVTAHKHDINISVDSKGKSIYTNDKMRDAELGMRLLEDVDYIKFDNEIKKMDTELYSNNSHIHFLEDKQRNIRSILNYLKSNKSIEELLD